MAMSTLDDEGKVYPGKHTHTQRWRGAERGEIPRKEQERRTSSAACCRRCSRCRHYPFISVFRRQLGNDAH